MSAGLSDPRITRVDGRSITSSEIGDPSGYPVVWCHGGLSSRVDIALASESLNGLPMRLITLDRPGIGDSDRQKGRTVASWPRDAAAVADDLGIERFAVAGWSAGGPYALACAAALPGRVTAAEDTLVSAVDSQRVVDALPGATLHSIPAAGHFLFATHATEVFGGLLDDVHA